jgi:UDP-2,3-diacylglucosamine pyrophosphatase LpxH
MEIFEGAWVFETGRGQQMMIHGDELLPSDFSYQKFKATIRNPLLLGVLKCLPMSMLLKLSGKTRSVSREKIAKISYDKFKMDCELIQKACEDNKIVKCWAGHLHVAQKQTFKLESRNLEVEILPQSTAQEFHALAWRGDSEPEYLVWN